uniref:Serine proteinase inhibitor n=1 Tax=Cucumis metuliferus TaxID=61886 RepID=A0A0M3SAG8_9ROSI|nr:serine proteinase inhibitor [Cucumis metuliferus]
MADICPPGKNQWPELVGIKATTAEYIIRKDNPSVEKVIVLLAGTGTTKDIRCDRVWLFVNIEEKVVEIPKVG